VIAFVYLLLSAVATSDDSIVFSIVSEFVSLFLCCHDNSRTAAHGLRLMKFCTDMYLER